MFHAGEFRQSLHFSLSRLRAGMVQTVEVQRPSLAPPFPSSAGFQVCRLRNHAQAMARAQWRAHTAREHMRAKHIGLVTAITLTAYRLRPAPLRFGRANLECRMRI